MVAAAVVIYCYFKNKILLQNMGETFDKEERCHCIYWSSTFWEKMIKLLILCLLYCLHTCVSLNFIYLLFQKMLRSQCLCTCIYLTLSFCKKKNVIIVNIFLSLYCLHMSLNLTIVYFKICLDDSARSCD